MMKQRLRVVPWRFCLSGTCDKVGPLGRIDFSNVHIFEVGASRLETSFDVTYDNAHARCRQVSDPMRSFTCSIQETAGAAYELELHASCTGGMVAIAVDGVLVPGWTIETDVVSGWGRKWPSREVSLVDDKGVLAMLDAPFPDNLDLFTRRAAQLSSAQLLMLISVQAFLQLESLPQECVTST